MTDTSGSPSSLLLASIVAVVIWPSFLLLALDIYGLQGWLRECRVWHEPPGTGMLAVLFCASAGVLIALLINLHRLIRLGRRIRSLPPLDEAKTRALRESLPDLARIDLRVYPGNVPQAFTAGWRIPVIVLSSWLLENLDAQEFAATVAHELAHIRRRDSLLMFWVHSLCPGGFGLPPLRRQIRHLTVLIENRADSMGAEMAGSLALASTLTKVGKHLASPRAALIQSLTGNDRPSVLHQRVLLLLGEARSLRRPVLGLALLFSAFLAGTAWLAVHAYAQPPCEGLHCDVKTMTQPSHRG